jgi:hypothetical protein
MYDADLVAAALVTARRPSRRAKPTCYALHQTARPPNRLAAHHLPRIHGPERIEDRIQQTVDDPARGHSRSLTLPANIRICRDDERDVRPKECVRKSHLPSRTVKE